MFLWCLRFARAPIFTIYHGDPLVYTSMVGCICADFQPDREHRFQGRALGILYSNNPNANIVKKNWKKKNSRVHRDKSCGKIVHRTGSGTVIAVTRGGARTRNTGGRGLNVYIKVGVYVRDVRYVRDIDQLQSRVTENRRRHRRRRRVCDVRVRARCARAVLTMTVTASNARSIYAGFPICVYIF